MNARTPQKVYSWRPIVTAFTIWFVHFMVCWIAAEVWPDQWAANALAWGSTLIAALAIGIHFVHVRAQFSQGALSAWSYRFAQGAVAIAGAAVLFSAVASVAYLP